MRHMVDREGPAEFYFHLIKKCPRPFPRGVVFYTVEDAEDDVWAALHSVSITVKPLTN